jgi:hypothetical protein
MAAKNMTPGARKVRRTARSVNGDTSLARSYRSKARAFYGDDSDITDPAEVLLQEIRRTAGHIEWLREQIQLSDPLTFVKSLWLVRRQSGYINPREIDLSSFSDAGSLWVDLYLQERKHLASICRTALAAGIEERRVRLAERQAENLGRAIIGMLGDLGIDADDDQVRATIYRWLVLATTGGEPETNKVLPIEGKVLGS